MFRRIHFHSPLTAFFVRKAEALPATRQVAELRKQIPTLYGLLCVNTLTLAATHLRVAPAFLTLIVPAFVVILCIARAVSWWRLRPEAMTEAQAIRQLNVTTGLTAVLSAMFVAWAMALREHGNPYEQCHAVIFICVTIIACTFCLTHLPAAAYVSTGTVLVVFLASCALSGNDVFVAVAIDTAFVTVVIVRILANNYRDFVDLVASKAEASRLSDENARLAHTDSLTGLPNRRYFFQRLEDMTRIYAAEGRRFALAIFDLDQFKPINDTYGHTAGDRVLAETARRLSTFAGPDVTVVRLGGDEFGVIIHDPGPREAVIAFCDRICAVLQEPILLDEIRVVAGCSCGLAKFPSAGHMAEALFDRADYALYHSKSHRRGRTTLFSQVHEDAIRAERAVETALRTADLAAEMRLHYQPILDTATGEITLVEALARWTSRILGEVPPDRFIAAAERCGMIQAVTLLLLRKALDDCASLPPPVGLSFNLSAHDLVAPETVEAIIAIVRESELDPRRLTLELTETALMRDFEQAKTAIVALRALGIKVALDDFGTGYSSLGYVHRLPLDKIKIDRSFMAAVDTEVGGSVIATILTLCRNLGLDGIAEGIETPDQREAARRHGCRYIQGYLVGRPMPIDHLLGRLAEDERPRLSA